MKGIRVIQIGLSHPLFFLKPDVLMVIFLPQTTPPIMQNIP